MEHITYRFLKRLSGFVIIACVLWSCDALVEEDVSNKPVALLTPPNAFVSSDFTIAFKWEDVEEADFYRIQIVKPDFENTVQFLVDSLTSQSEFSFSFESGAYEWRVRSENNNSQSDYAVGSFVVDVSDLSNQTLVLSAPVDFFVSNENTQDFTWEELPTTENYNFQLYGDLNGGIGDPIGDELTVFSNTLTSTLSEGAYWWGVAGIGSNSQTDMSLRRITIDTTAPSQALLDSPNDGESISTATYLFSWTSGSDNLTNFSDSLLIFEDELLSIPALGIASPSNAISATVSSLAPGAYYWIVSRRDEAGNFVDSETRQFIIP